MIAEARTRYATEIRSRVGLGTTVYDHRPETAAAPFVYLELESIDVAALDAGDTGAVTLAAVVVVDVALAPGAAGGELDMLTDRTMAAAYAVGIPDQIRAGVDQVPVGAYTYPAHRVTCTQPFDPCDL